MQNERPDHYSSPSHPENKMLFYYLVTPLLLGILLGDGLDIDMSSTAAQYVGLLRFIQTAGIDIRTKSMIFILYLAFAPCYWHYFFKRRKSNPPSPDPVKIASASRLLVLIVGVLLMFLAAYALIFIGPHEDALITPDHQIRLLLACSKWNISFALFMGGIVWAGMASIYTTFLFINELLLRLKNRITNSTRRSK